MYKRIALIMHIVFSSWSDEGKQLLDKVVAVVNNGVITVQRTGYTSELSKKQIHCSKNTNAKESVLRKQVLQHLIDVDLQMQMAKQHGITVDDTELNQAIERIATSNHITLSQLREEIIKTRYELARIHDIIFVKK